MNSNITLKSNIYINKTCKRDDQDFIYHILDFRVLKRYAGDSIPKTSTQKMILEQGAPDCVYEHGTMSWGVPVGSERFVCRCEEYGCSMHATCQNLPNYEQIERETEETLDTAKANEKRNTPAQHEDSISIQQVEMKSQSDCAKIAEPERMNAPAASKPEMQVTPIKTIETVAETDTAIPVKMDDV